MNTSLQQGQQPKLLNYKNLNREKYEYLLPHKTQFGYYQSNCNYRLSKNQLLPFYIETPKLKTTSGIVKIDNKFYIDLEISQSGENSLFYDFLSKNDDNNISVCHENSKEWFSQLMPLNIVEKYYKTPIIQKSKGQLPIFRVRLPSYKGNILTEIFNIKKEKMNDINCIQSGDYLVGIIEFIGLMFMSQNFTPCYELHKIKLFKDNDIRILSSGYMFSDMNDKVDLNNNIKTDNIMEDPIVNENENKNTYVDTHINTYVDTYKSPKSKNDNLDLSVLNIKNVKPIDTIIPDTSTSTTTTPTPTPTTTPTTTPKTTKSLFDIIKETRFKDFIIDEELFKNNIKLFNKPNTEDLTKTVVINKVENKKYVKHTNDLMNILDNYDTSGIENMDINGKFFQDSSFLKKQNLENEQDEKNEQYEQYGNEQDGNEQYDEDGNEQYDEDGNEQYNEDGNEQYDENDNEQYDENDNEQYDENDNEEDEEYDEYDENIQQINEEDKYIDYDTLNDLEVIVFDE
jgi:hypothetical protein